MKEMHEMPVAAGEWVEAAINRLVAEAPAFCVFNDIRLVAEVGATRDSVYEQYDIETRRRVKEQEEKEAEETRKRTANWIWAIRKNERTRIVQRIRELRCPLTPHDVAGTILAVAEIIEAEPVSEDGP